MDFFEFLDTHYRNNAVELSQNFSLIKDGQAKAAYSLIGAYRTIIIWSYRPILLAKFVFMKFHIMKAPELLPILKKPKLETIAEKDVQVQTA